MTDGKVAGRRKESSSSFLFPPCASRRHRREKIPLKRGRKRGRERKSGVQGLQEFSPLFSVYFSDRHRRPTSGHICPTVYSSLSLSLYRFTESGIHCPVANFLSFRLSAPMKNTRGGKKNSFRDFSQSVLLDIQYLSCKYFPHSSTIASNRKYCRTFIEHTYSGAKSDVPASPGTFSRSIFLPFSLPPVFVSLSLLSYLPSFRSISLYRFPSLPSSILRFCLLSSASPPPSPEGEENLS